MTLLLILLALATPRPALAALPPEVVLVRYVQALEAVPLPKTLSFQYTIEQLGGRDIDQTHRVYRSGTNERDETLVVDGEKVVPPQVRIFHGRPDRYALTNIAPRPYAYDFTYVGPRSEGLRVEYVFRTTPKTPGPFSVTEVTIDGLKFLPVSVQFQTALGGVVGSGSITYGPSGRYWVPLAVNATARDVTRTVRERIVFSAYGFPPKLPPGTFGASPQ
ncbi:MAG TPA: hypothetical protein VN905_03895 [Candidatus Binatia bacterium]|nr:hypothetical protein [Candidatus Binatia bacterium]